ncbi:MAG: hypothetical protein Q9167_007918 [Letrouitia subvulpina]
MEAKPVCSLLRILNRAVGTAPVVPVVPVVRVLGKGSNTLNTKVRPDALFIALQPIRFQFLTNHKIEDVKACLAKVAWWRLRDRDGVLEVCADAEAGAEAENHGGREEDVDLRSEAAVAELLDAGLAGDDEAADNEDDREEGDDGVKGLAVEDDVSVDALGVLVQGVEALDVGGDQHDQADDDEDVDCVEEVGEEGVPAAVGMRGSDDPLGKDEVDDEEKDDACGDEDGSGDGDGSVVRITAPDDTHDTGDDAGHAEAEHHGGHDEFVASTEVDLEDGHVGDGAADEQKEEDGGDWDIGSHGRMAAQRCGLGRIWSMSRGLRGRART